MGLHSELCPIWQYAWTHSVYYIELSQFALIVALITTTDSQIAQYTFQSSRSLV